MRGAASVLNYPIVSCLSDIFASQYEHEAKWHCASSPIYCAGITNVCMEELRWSWRCQLTRWTVTCAPHRFPIADRSCTHRVTSCCRHLAGHLVHELSARVGHRAVIDGRPNSLI